MGVKLRSPETFKYDNAMIYLLTLIEGVLSLKSVTGLKDESAASSPYATGIRGAPGMGT